MAATISTEPLPPNRPCEYCPPKDNPSMCLRFINSNNAIYICETCDEVYPDNGLPIKVNINNQPFDKSDLEQIGLPVELLSYFPCINLEFANKIIKVINNKWRQQLNNLWKEFTDVNDKINRKGGDSRKMECRKESNHCAEKDDSFLFDISSIDEKELAEIMRVLDLIESKQGNKTVDKNINEIQCLDTETFFQKYDHSKRNPHMKQRTYTTKRKNMVLENRQLEILEHKLLLKNVQLMSSLNIHNKNPKINKDVCVGTGKGLAWDAHPSRITNQNLSKMLEISKF